RVATRGRGAASGRGGYGPLVRSAECPEFWIPEGFHCRRLSVTTMPSAADPQLIVPPAIDGMAAFPLPNGNVRLIRNHEMSSSAATAVPIGTRPYDPRAAGGTTSLEVPIEGGASVMDVRVVAEYVSLSGTLTNCAGGPTPWGSWLSCEEAIAGPNRGYAQPHGYVFEVPASATREVDAVPLKAMGRFVHEAVAVDPVTGIVYETEDAWWIASDPDRAPGSGFYRFIPGQPGRLIAGGRLEMLAIDGAPGYDTIQGQTPGRPLPVRWVPIHDPDPAAAEQDAAALFRAGRELGGARFQRLEGCFTGDGGIYFVSTNGGDAAAGQVWHYRTVGPEPDTLRLVFESPSPDVLEGPDNICVSPRGGLILCEDGSAEQYVRGLTPAGEIVDLVLAPAPLNRPGPSEFAGATFSPDGRVLFFNVQGGFSFASPEKGATYALWGPWENGAL
ncbi:MAG: PhoX family protein, partial [Gemmatimonadetes bacterium]|nr:PhoX family protein [Gemmatimonadota bacterium]